MSLPKTRFIGLYIFVAGRMGIFNNICVIGRITQKCGHYAVPGSLKFVYFGTNRKAYATFYLINTNLHSTSYHFQIIADYSAARPDVSRGGLKFYPWTFFFFFINPPRSAATQRTASNVFRRFGRR